MHRLIHCGGLLKTMEDFPSSPWTLHITKAPYLFKVKLGMAQLFRGVLTEQYVYKYLCLPTPVHGVPFQLPSVSHPLCLTAKPQSDICVLNVTDQSYVRDLAPVYIFIFATKSLDQKDFCYNVLVESLISIAARRPLVGLVKGSVRSVHSSAGRLEPSGASFWEAMGFLLMTKSSLLPDSAIKGTTKQQSKSLVRM